MKRSIKRDGTIIGDILLYMLLAAVAVVSFYPFFYVLFLSVMPYNRFIESPVHLLPSGFTLDYFRQVLQNKNMPHAYLMSILRTLTGTTLSVFATIFAGYAISKPNMKLGKLLNALFLVPMFFGAGLIPYYVTVSAYRLTNTFWILILPGLVSPMWFFVVKSTFRDYPTEILEACEIDGAGQWRILLQIVMPTSLPTMATLALMYGMGHWNEYFMTRLLVKSDMWTAPVYLFGMINQKITLQGLGLGQRAEPQSYISAVAASLILPVLLVYPLLQRYVISGLTAGAVKG